MNAHRLWMLGGVVVALAIAVVAFVFGVQPQLAQAGDAALQQVQAEATLQQSRIQLAQLKKDYASIGQLESQLAALQKSVPGSGRVTDFVRGLSAQASAAQVAVSSINVGAAVAYAPKTAPAPAGVATPVATPAATPAARPGATPAPTARAAAVAADAPAVAPPLDTNPVITPANFVMIPVSLTAAGTPDQIMAFTKGLQTGGSRLFLIDKIDAKAGAGSNAAADSFTATISGYIYVLVGN